MKNNRERLAWFILLFSFFLCVVLAVGTPLGVQYFLRTASASQKASLEPQEGTPRMRRRGQGEAIALIGPTWDVPAGTVISTDTAAEGLLTLYTPGPESEAVAWVKIYDQTEVVLRYARSPRFSVSSLPHRVALEVRLPTHPQADLSPEQTGRAEARVRVSVVPAGGRDTVMEIHTSHFVALLQGGSYEIRVRDGQAELSVIEGTAQITPPDGKAVVVDRSQRAVVRSGSGSVDILPGERNLLRNGDFRLPLEEDWQVYHKDVQQNPPGTVEAITFAGRSVARFHREGMGHAEVGIGQQVNYDVRDFTSLVFRLSVLIQNQSLPGCGQLGSECPILVRIDYKDVYGTDRTWYHGFFSQPPGGTDLLNPWDERIPPQAWYTFDSGNLIDPENPVGPFEVPPALIKGVTIYASGHSFEALVTDVELLAQE